MSQLPNPNLAQQWRERIERFGQSKLTIAAFCRLEGCSPASFYHWRRRLRADQTGKHTAAFVAVELPASNHRAQLAQHSTGGLQIELPGGAIARLDHDATDEQRCRLIKNIIESLSEVVS